MHFRKKILKMRFSLFLAQIFLGNAKNDVRWPKEREFWWMREGPELSSEELISLKDQSKPLSGIYHESWSMMHVEFLFLL